MRGEKMAEQQSRLAIVIDSTGAQRNAEGLAGALSGLTEWGQKAAASSGKVTKATDQEAKSLSALLDKIDPVNAALNRLDDQQRQLSKFQAKGFIDTETFADYSKKIEQTRAGLNAYASEAGKAGMSSRQLAANMRLVPAQMTDIVVSLASGQAPLTVLLQQGGQLKDMFGGIGPAFRALGTYVSGLISPLSVAAASAAALGLAFYQGSQEQSEFNKTLILTGNTLGTTSGQLGQLSKQLADATGSTTSRAADVLNQIVTSGKVSKDTIQEVAASIISMTKATGIAADSMVSDFEKIAKDPAGEIAKLNDQYHFLSIETYNHIRQLQEEGNLSDAARVATVAYSSELKNRANEIKNSLGDLAKGWDNLWGSASRAWDAMRDSGRSQTPESQLATLEASLQDAKRRQAEGGILNRFAANANGYNIPEMEKQVSILKSQITTQDVLNGAIGDYNNRQQDGIKAQERINQLNEQTLSNAEKRSKAQKELTRDLEKARAAGSAISAEEEKRIRANIDDKFKDPKTPKVKAYRDDAADRLLLQLKEQNAALAMQESTGYKIGAQQQALIKWEQQLSDLKSKGTLTADQKSLLANADILTKQYQQNAALERQIETAQKALALERARADINRTIANRMSQYSTDEMFAGGGFSQYEQQQYTQRLSLEQSYNDKISQLRQQRASATTEIAREEIDQEIQLQQQALQTELSNYDAHMQRMNDLRGNFTAGAKRAWQEYQDSAANVSAMSQQLFSNAFNGMEDSLVKFVTTGKASFSDFANSVLADIARIAIRQSLVGIGNSFSGGFGSLFASGAAASVRANAKGGVYDSPSLSAYSGGVYDSPKFFAFAKGAGVFGEAGPEAIMPLKRGPDGSLGVRMVDGGQSGSARSGDVIIHQTIQVSGSGDAALQRAMEEAARKGATDGAKQARQDMLQDFQNRGQGRRLLGV
jgi:lambda family phage tail tape measure protein